MIEYADFGDRVEAHLLYLLDAPVDEVALVLRRRLEDGTWRQAARQFATTLVVKAGRPGGEALRELFPVVADHLAAGVLDDASRIAIEVLTRSHGGFGDLEVQTVSAWLQRVAGPGDASLVGMLVEGAREPAMRVAIAPLVPWLIDHGAAELRSRRSHHLVFELLELVLTSGDDERLLPAVRYVLASEVPPPSWFGRGDGARGSNVLIAAIERLLELRHASAALVADLARAMPPDGAGNLLGEAVGADELPRVHAAVLQMLMAGELHPDAAKNAWPHVFDRLIPDANAAWSERGLDTAMQAFGTWVWSRRDAYGRQVPGTRETQRAWSTFIVGALLARGFPRHTGGHPAEHVMRLLGYSGDVDHGVLAAIRIHVQGLPQAPALLVKLVARETARSGTIKAALTLLESSHAPAETADVAPLLQGTLAAVSRILGTAAAAPVVHLSGVDRVCTATLSGSDKVAIEGTTLIVDVGELGSLARTPLSLEEQVLLGALYVVHEVIHLQQGIGDKAVVTTLRSVGAESTLMQLDLAADHLAARVVSGAMGHPVAHLKDLQGRSLTAFPTSAYHTSAARARKANRLVGLRFDVAARRLGILADDADEHVFCDHGPAGGELVILASGPPVRLVGKAPLTREDAKTLSAAADPALPVGRIDEIAERCLRRSCRS